MSHVISAVNVFKFTLGLWSSQLRNNVTEHFPNPEKIQQNVRERVPYQN